MKKYFLSLLLISIAYAVSAQIPGYQGKRFCLGYNASSFTVLDGLTDGNDAIRLSYKTEISANYTVSRKVSMGLSYYFAKQKYYVPQTEIENIGYFKPEMGKVPCGLQIFEFHMQFFRKNFIAPAGLYHQFGIGVIKYGLATSDNKLVLIQGSSGYAPMTIEGPSDKYSGAKLSYHIGKTNPIGHNFYINTAIGLNFIQSGDTAKVDEYRVNSTIYLLYAFNKNLRKHNFAEIKIGFGWLAF